MSVSSNLLLEIKLYVYSLKWQLKRSFKNSVLLIVRSIRSRKTPTTSPTCHCLPNVSAVPEYTFSSFKTKCLPFQHFRSWRSGQTSKRDVLLYLLRVVSLQYFVYIFVLLSLYTSHCRVRSCEKFRHSAKLKRDIARKFHEFSRYR